MKKLLAVLLLLLTGCVTLESNVRYLEKQYTILQEKYKDGVVVYKAVDKKSPIDSITLNMNQPDQIDMLIKYNRWSFIYGLGFKYDHRGIESEVKIAKIEYKIFYEELFGIVEKIKLTVEEAKEFVKHKQITITIRERQ